MSAAVRVAPSSSDEQSLPAPNSIALPARTPPPETPEVPPQLVACGKRDFYRITENSLQGFEISPVLQPHAIRGSRVARQTTQTDVAEPRNVVSLGAITLVIAGSNVFRFELGQKRAQRYAPIAVQGPLEAWPEPRAERSFWVRAARDTTLREYTLEAVRPAETGTAVPPTNEGEYAVRAGRVEELPNFDLGLFTVLANGTPLYSRADDLWHGRALAKAAPLPKLPGAPVVLFADSTAERWWAGDALGNLLWWNQNHWTEVARVPGVVINAATDGARVAVLSLELDGDSFRPHVTVFEGGRQRGRLDLAPSFASAGQPRLDLCLLPERSWVVVGGQYWMQLLDWNSPRLLAEW